MTTLPTTEAQPIWVPSAKRIGATNMYKYLQFINDQHNKSFTTYDELYEWSITNIADFWESMWQFLDIKASADYNQVIDDPNKMPGAKWFAGTELNFAENLLRFRDDQLAIIFKGEAMQEARRITYARLYSEVSYLAHALRAAGVTAGDRVVGFMPNMPEAIIAMLATTSLGAVWSSCSPDFGIKGVLDRFKRLEPKVLFTANGYSYGGKKHNSLEKVAGIIKQLPMHPRVIVVSYTEFRPDISMLHDAVHYRDFIAYQSDGEIDFAQLPFDHPLYIMYSSGTTGLPKCIVQSAGGILLNQKKELVLHADLKREDNLFYFTTCGWMMWNWMVAALSVGATITLYDGSPFYPGPEALWQLAEDEGITIFGTSAKYLAALEKVPYIPREHFKLKKLKAVLSTGSPLSEESFEFVYREIKKDICLSSISGGTDLNGCFAGGNPMGPVYRGELQARCLGMKVESYNEQGKHELNHKGELVCTAAFPSMPIYFWADPDGELYHNAYFAEYPNIWRHGDFIEINDHGGVIMYGRSDATLNPGGVRIGTAEIYRQVETLEEVLDSLVIGQDWEDDVRVILFLKLAHDKKLTDELIDKIKKTIRANCTPRHVPAKIIEVKDIPYTISGKKVELAVRNIIHNRPVKNKDALANPQALENYVNLKALQV